MESRDHPAADDGEIRHVRSSPQLTVTFNEQRAARHRYCRPLSSVTDNRCVNQAVAKPLTDLVVSIFVFR